mgnify:CR=1 FL=1
MVEELILGIDDAGRGPVIGPMILAGCLVTKKTEKEFRNLGVTDSKQLTQKRREFLEEKIKELAETFEVVIVQPEKIDEHVEKNKLNELEALACAEIINKINKGYGRIKVVIDCPSVNITKWSDFLKNKVTDHSNLEISCEHKADVNHVAVSAASVLAKCVREKEMAKLKELYGDGIGSGYSSDPYTKKFIEHHGNEYKDKGIIRKSWGTWKDSQKVAAQRKLF